MFILCRGGEGGESLPGNGLLSLAFLLPSYSTWGLRVHSASGVAQGKLAVTRKAGEESWVQCTLIPAYGKERSVCVFLGVHQLSCHPGKMKCHWICYSVPIQHDCLFSGLCSLDSRMECLSSPLGGRHGPKRIAHSSCCALCIQQSWREAMPHFSSRQRNERDSKLVLLAAPFHQSSLKDFTCRHIPSFFPEGPGAYFWELWKCPAGYFFVLGNPSCRLLLPQVSRNSVQPPAHLGPP